MNLKIKILLSILSVSAAFDNRRCLLHRGKCVSYCPRKMHPYHTRCDGQTMAQRTCDSPKGYLLGYTCGWSRCDCNAELVFDEKSAMCVTLDFCKRNRIPDEVRKRYGDTDKEDRRRSKIRHSKKIRVNEDDPSISHLA